MKKGMLKGYFQDLFINLYGCFRTIRTMSQPCPNHVPSMCHPCAIHVPTMLKQAILRRMAHGWHMVYT
ncbi:hypothetical protein [Flavihumibacter profundi]|uniref:hypothetical protein n=1 Tax=Flavihumibacter profundi TaxID=2716883 RepID=UPI001CC38BAC|nr:hypothetical protein [Flavihumibacter profundi]MBZ5856573.1 hypothetical protein [Flavihumibacter profundi]